MNEVEPESFSFGPFRLQPRTGMLTCHGLPIPLTPKEFDTLRTLVEAGGKLVSKDELVARVWPDSHVGDGSLARNISVLRKALGDEVIETSPRRGYRLALPIKANFAERASENRIEAPSDVGERGQAGFKIEAPTTPRWRAVIPAAGLVVLLCVLLVSAAFLLSRPHKHDRPIQSVAVVISAVPAGDLQSEILADAAGESAIHALQRTVNLRVLAQHSLVPPQRAEATGRTLGGDAVLTLATERTGDELRIHIATLASDRGNRLWDETVVGRVSDAAWVSADVGEVVLRHFGAAAKTHLQPGVNDAAFRDYVRGRYFWNKRTPADLDEAFSSFQAAVREDPNFALAYAGLAQTYAVADLHDDRYHGRAETYQQAREAAQRALAIDPQLASAHAVLAQILRNYDRNMAGAEREYLKAIELDPADATTHQWYAEFLTINGRHNEAIAEIDRARELDPLSAVITAVAAYVRLYARRYDEVLPLSYEALRLDPHYDRIYSNVADALEAQGLYLRAFDARAKEAEIAGDTELANAVREDKADYLRAGVHGLWQGRLRRVLKGKPTPDRYYLLARAYCRVGDSDRCLAMLRLAVEERGETVVGIKIEPAFDIIHDDSRYMELVRGFGFTPDPRSAVSLAEPHLPPPLTHGQ